MTRRPYWFSIAGPCLLTLSAASVTYAQAGNYPDKPVTIISDAAPGAALDVATRAVAERLAKIWRQQVAVVNHRGANGSIAARGATVATPDGYTAFTPALVEFVALPTGAPNLPRDFPPVEFTSEQPMFIAVAPSLGVATLPQLIELAKKESGKISIATTGIGHATYLTGELLQARADIKLLPVSYTHGPASAIGDVATGRVSLIIIGNFAGITGAVKAGQVKLIAVASLERLSEFPDLPTVVETIPDFSATGYRCNSRAGQSA